MVSRYMIDSTGRPWRDPRGLYVWHSDYDNLAADFLALKEYCAALESREVCTVAHEDVETRGYCQRDALSKDAERYHRVMQIIRALCAAKTPELLADFDAAMGEKP